MKANRTLIAAVILVSLLLAHDALAFYNPQAGRWLSRDPIGEKGGANLTRFAVNAPTDRVDANGLWIPGVDGGATPAPMIRSPRGPVAQGITWGKLCIPRARQIIADALNNICTKITSPEFQACMGRGLAGEYAEAMKDLCSQRAFRIECDDKCYLRLLGHPRLPCSGIADTETDMNGN